MDKKITDILYNVIELFKAEEHIMWDETEGRWYCTGYCEANECPALQLNSILEKIK